MNEPIYLRPSMFHEQGLKLSQRDGQIFLQKREGEGWKDVAVIASKKR